MKFFLDTANLNEIREGAALGLVDGVTTNPSLVAKEGGVDFKQHVAAICELVKGDVSAEVTSLDTEGMLGARVRGDRTQRGGAVAMAHLDDPTKADSQW